MFSSVALEVGIGLIFSFLAFSLILSSVVEVIESVMKHRAVDLQQALAELLDDHEGTGLRKQFMSHGLIWGQFQGTPAILNFPKNGGAARQAITLGKSLPSYIPHDLFAAAFVDLMRSGSGTPSDKVKQAWEVLNEVAGNDVQLQRLAVERWYDATMERASGWYKRRTQRMLFGLGVSAAILLNVNAVLIADHLAESPQARVATLMASQELLDQGLLAQNLPAQEVLDGEATPVDRKRPLGDVANAAKQVEFELQRLRDGGLPVGWGDEGVAALKDTEDEQPILGFITIIAGWLAMAFAATMGAPFWFDLLGKFMQVRSSQKPNPAGACHLQGANL